MFGLVNMLATLLSWGVFLAIVAVLVWLGMFVARKAGAGPRARRWTGIIVGLLAFVTLNVPLNRFAGRLYFEHLCETEAGEFIYRTVDNVEGLYLMRLRDPRDYYDRIWAHDPPEDPYGHTNFEAQEPGGLFVNPPWANYKFIEMPLVAGPADGVAAPGYLRLSGYQQEADAGFIKRYGYVQVGHPMVLEAVPSLRSRYGYTWIEASTRTQLAFGIHRGELSVLDLATGTPLARKVGFLNLRGGGACPGGKEDTLVYDFVSKVLKPLSPSVQGR